MAKTDLITTVIMKCNKGCTHEYQDTLYGKGNRVFNWSPKATTGTHRCTVCSNTQ